MFAGGQARRFGSDKALAPWNGQPLLAHVVARLGVQVDRVAVVGREWPGCVALADRPPGGHGPLAALAAALAYAADRGFATVLTSGCDLPDLPEDVGQRLAPAPAVVDGQPLLGLWPVVVLPALDRHLAEGGRSMRGWIAASGARTVALDRPVANINRPEDLTALRPWAGPRSSP